MYQGGKGNFCWLWKTNEEIQTAWIGRTLANETGSMAALHIRYVIIYTTSWPMTSAGLLKEYKMQQLYQTHKVCVYFLKIDIYEMVISGKINACVLFHKESQTKTNKCRHILWQWCNISLLTQHGLALRERDNFTFTTRWIKKIFVVILWNQISIQKYSKVKLAYLHCRLSELWYTEYLSP